jgi:shikimate dehydrogenase
MEQMQHFGLIGYPLTHSFSPGWFAGKFAQESINARYDLYPLPDIAGFPALLQANPALLGLNVTIPWKEAVMPLLTEIDAAARQVGAVNCIRIREGRTTGYNTDIIGFEKSLRPLLQPWHTSALVLGTGGAAQAVLYVLKKLGIEAISVSRSAARNGLTYAAIKPDLLQKNLLIVNTTPLGMYPDTGLAPQLAYTALTGKHLLYDLIYNPAETEFLKRGRLAGTATKNGLEMLQIQAEESWKIWADLQ